jgi:rubrerythrin
MRRFLRKGFAGRGRGRGNTTKVCTCPECGHEEPYTRGTPCTQKKCPKCGATMKGDFCL